MGRTITVISGIWTFALLPNLCSAGALVHPCDCESTNGCSHETECSDDPCNSMALLREDTPGELLTATTQDVPVSSAVTCFCAPLPCSGLYWLKTNPPPWSALKSAYPSDLPLLI